MLSWKAIDCMNQACFQLAERPMTSRLDLLKRHLNYSDLLVIFVYVPSRACWLLTYDWRGGDLLCRVVKMMHTVAFQVCFTKVGKCAGVLAGNLGNGSKSHWGHTALTQLTQRLRGCRIWQNSSHSSLPLPSNCRDTKSS